MELWDRLITILRMMRGTDRRSFALDEKLQTALVDRAERGRGRVRDSHCWIAGALVRYCSSLTTNGHFATAISSIISWATYLPVEAKCKMSSYTKL